MTPIQRERTGLGARVSRAGVAIWIAVLGAAGCTAPYVIDEWRTDYVPRAHLGDQLYDFTVKVVDDCDHPIDGTLVRLRGIRKLNRFRDGPESEFYLFGRSGEAGEPGMVHFRFPAPRDPHAFDLYAVLYDRERDFHDTYFFPGAYWYLKGAYQEIDLGKDRHAFVHLEPPDA